MALLTDRNLIDVPSLIALDDDVLTDVDAEGIDADAKLALAEEEVRDIVDKRLRDLSENMATIPATLGQVVVTSPLERWLQYRALELIYREAYFNELNLRYREKADWFGSQAQASRRLYFEQGIGVTDTPLPRPGAAQVDTFAGSLAAGSYLVATTWEDQSGEESAPGKLQSVVVTTGETIRIRQSDMPGSAVGWNVYVAYAGGELCKQNSTPLGQGEAWIQPANPLSECLLNFLGQQPDRYLQQQPILRRG
jgi:hypothetical protein